MEPLLLFPVRLQLGKPALTVLEGPGWGRGLQWVGAVERGLYQAPDDCGRGAR